MSDTPLIQRIARRHIESVTGQPMQPAASPAVAGSAIQPFMPGLAPDFLKDIIDKQDKLSEKSRIGKMGLTHVSTLTSGTCPREHVLAGLYDKVGFNTVTGGHRLIWKYGRAAEAHIREQLTTGDQRQRFQIYGKWKCVCGDTEHVGARPAQSGCFTCKQPLDQYHEQPFADQEYGLIGNPDITLILGRYFLPVEIKSMNRKDWEALAAPLAEHVNQALMYRWAMMRNGLLVHRDITFLYAAKEFKWGSPYKQFMVDATTTANVRMVERTLEAALEIKTAFDTKTPPPRWAHCSSPDSPKAKGCAQCSLCFGLPA